MPVGTGGFYPNPGSGTMQQPIYTGPVYQQPAATPQPNTSIAWVRGEAEAYAFPIAAGTSVLLMDRNSMTLYSKTVDMSGRLSMEIYDLVKREDKLEADVVSGIESLDFVKKGEVEKMVSDAVNKAMQKKGSYKPYHKNQKEDE